MCSRLPKAGQSMRSFQAAKDLPADALGRFVDFQITDREDSFSVVIAILRTQSIAALRNRADAAPFAVVNLEYFFNQLQCRRVALAAHRSDILILNFCSAVFELPDGPQNPLQADQSAQSR